MEDVTSSSPPGGFWATLPTTSTYTTTMTVDEIFRIFNTQGVIFTSNSTTYNADSSFWRMLDTKQDKIKKYAKLLAEKNSEPRIHNRALYESQKNFKPKPPKK